MARTQARARCEKAKSARSLEICIARADNRWACDAWVFFFPLFPTAPVVRVFIWRRGHRRALDRGFACLGRIRPLPAQSMRPPRSPTSDRLRPRPCPRNPRLALSLLASLPPEPESPKRSEGLPSTPGSPRATLFWWLPCVQVPHVFDNKAHVDLCACRRPLGPAPPPVALARKSPMPSAVFHRLLSRLQRLDEIWLVHGPSSLSQGLSLLHRSLLLLHLAFRDAEAFFGHRRRIRLRQLLPSQCESLGCPFRPARLRPLVDLLNVRFVLLFVEATARVPAEDRTHLARSALPFRHQMATRSPAKPPCLCFCRTGLFLSVVGCTVHTTASAACSPLPAHGRDSPAKCSQARCSLSCDKHPLNLGPPPSNRQRAALVVRRSRPHHV